MFRVACFVSLLAYGLTLTILPMVISKSRLPCRVACPVCLHNTNMSQTLSWVDLLVYTLISLKKVWGGGTLGGSEESGVQIGMIRNTTLFLRGVQLTDVVRNRLHDVWEQERIGHLWLGPPYEPGVDGFSNIRGHLMGTDPHSDRAVPSTFNSLFAWGGQS